MRLSAHEQTHHPQTGNLPYPLLHHLPLNCQIPILIVLGGEGGEGDEANEAKEAEEAEEAKVEDSQTVQHRVTIAAKERAELEVDSTLLKGFGTDRVRVRTKRSVGESRISWVFKHVLRLRSCNKTILIAAGTGSVSIATTIAYCNSRALQCSFNQLNCKSPNQNAQTRFS